MLLPVFLAASVASAAPPPQAVVNKMDADGDGRISASEWQKAPHVFERIDANGDGYVTADEIKAHRQRRAQQQGGTFGGGPTGAAVTTPVATGGGTTPADGWIDVHFHLIADMGDLEGFDKAAQEAIGVMDGSNIAKILAMPPPRPRKNFDFESISDLTRKYGSRIAFMAGGGTLNPMIQAAGHSPEVSDELRREFTETAEKILASGARGFGEIAAHHVSLNPGHGYEWVPPDHPLLLLLADIAARHNVPIDLHFDPIPKDVDTPSELNSPNNPPVLKENLAAFARLLAHNRNTTIVWAHAGSDPVGWYTPSLVSEMLDSHPNLYFSIRPANRPDTDPAWNPRDGINNTWVRVFENYPDRFVLGTDSFVVSENYSGKPATPVVFEQKTAIQRQGANILLSALDDDVRRKIARENAIRIYRLSE